MRVARLGLTAAALLAAAMAVAGEKPPAAGAPTGGEAKEKEPKGTPVSAADLEKLLAEWGAAQKKLKTVVTDFKCEAENALVAEPDVTCGVIRIKKPDGYRREVYEQKKLKGGETEKKLSGLMILKPPYLWVYLPKEKRAEEINLRKAGLRAGDNPLKRLGDIISFDEKRISKSFTMKAVKLKGDVFRMTYSPRAGKAIGNVAKVRVWMKKLGRFPLKMETTDGDGDVRTETYTGTKFDEELAGDLFKFKRPPGVKLIKVTK